MKILLVDDEQLARERLAELLRPFEDVAVVGEAEDGEQAIEKIIELRPDLVFMDIQMPGCSGIDVVASLPQPRPRIIFCTAFDQYAIDAFELEALDYLLKPVTRARLARALDRIRSAPTEAGPPSAGRVERVGGKAPTRFLAKRGNKFRVVPQQEVACFTSEEGLTRLCTREQEYWMQPTLSELEGRVDPGVFFRISRAAMVNLNWIDEVVPLVGGYGEVALKNGTRLEVSRRRMKELVQALEGN
jgi:two-component system LytT family response regulator